jgi:hypothetical protein
MHKNIKKNVLVSLLATLYKCYSPINYLITRFQWEDNLAKFTNEIPLNRPYSVLITLGKDDEEKAKTKKRKLYSAIGNALRAPITNVYKNVCEGVKSVIGKFFDKDIVNKIEQAAMQCGEAEMKFLKGLAVNYEDPA